MADFNFISPGAAAATALQKFLVDREAQQRQERLDKLMKQKQEEDLRRQDAQQRALEAYYAQQEAESKARIDSQKEDDARANAAILAGQQNMGADLSGLAQEQQDLLTRFGYARPQPSIIQSPGVLVPGQSDTIEGASMGPDVVTAVGSKAERDLAAKQALDAHAARLLDGVTNRQEASQKLLAAGVPFDSIDTFINAYMGPKITPPKTTVFYNSRTGGGLKIRGEDGQLRPVNATDDLSGEIDYKPYGESTSDTSSNNRSDRSYQYNDTKLEKIATPLEAAAQRGDRLISTIALATPQADALIPAELMVYLAGGQGTGVRINEAEINRVMGGRSAAQSLIATLQHYDPTKGGGLQVTPLQRQQMQQLAQIAADKIHKKLVIIDEARSDLNSTDNVAEHRSILARANKALNAIDEGSPDKAPPPPNRLTAKNPKTGEVIYSDDNGKTWHK
jgi:hypothetical protein